MKAISTFLLLLINQSFSHTTDSLNYYPARAGDVRQYRSQFTGDIAWTEYFDKDSVDQYGNTFIWYHRESKYRPGSGVYKIDSSNNFFEQLYTVNDTSLLLYKLDADTGTVWAYKKTPWDSILLKVINIYPSIMYGKQVMVKKYEETKHKQSASFWLGNRYLASGLGMVQWDTEPTDSYYLSGALINGVRYGIIVPVKPILTKPETFEVISNYPNPFNNSTTISYIISDQSIVNLTIYDMLGRKITTLVDDKYEKGNYEITFKGNDITSGIYFAILHTGTRTLIQKLLLLK